MKQPHINSRRDFHYKPCSADPILTFYWKPNIICFLLLASMNFYFHRGYWKYTYLTTKFAGCKPTEVIFLCGSIVNHRAALSQAIKPLIWYIKHLMWFLPNALSISLHFAGAGPRACILVKKKKKKTHHGKKVFLRIHFTSTSSIKAHFILSSEQLNSFEVSGLSGVKQMERNSEPTRDGGHQAFSAGINLAVCEQKPPVWGLFSVSVKFTASPWARRSFLSGAVVMRRISPTTRLSSVCLCTDSLMDNLHSPPGHVYTVWIPLYFSLPTI